MDRNTNKYSEASSRFWQFSDNVPNMCFILEIIPPPALRSLFPSMCLCFLSIIINFWRNYTLLVRMEQHLSAHIMGPDFASRQVSDKVLCSASLLRNYATLYCGLHRLKMPSIFLRAPALCGCFNIPLLSKYSQLKCKCTELNCWSKTHYRVNSILWLSICCL
jgi:hypothetical protein